VWRMTAAAWLGQTCEGKLTHRCAPQAAPDASIRSGAPAHPTRWSGGAYLDKSDQSNQHDGTCHPKVQREDDRLVWSTGHLGATRATHRIAYASALRSSTSVNAQVPAG